MSASLVARRYANAIYELGEETGQLESLTTDLGRVAELYDGSAELRAAIDNPLVTVPAKKAVLADVLERLGAGPLSCNTVQLLADRRRMRVLPLVAKYLREATDAKRGILRAQVTSAAPLSEDYYARLQQKLEAMTGKRIVLDRKQDPALIAGVVTRIGDRVFDGSLRARLDAMKAALLPN